MPVPAQSGSRYDRPTSESSFNVGRPPDAMSATGEIQPVGGAHLKDRASLLRPEHPARDAICRRRATHPNAGGRV